MSEVKYFPTIGIECHVQLKTKTKLFAAVDNDARGAAPNSLISHICIGMPGALPVLNEKAIELAARAAFALKTKPQSFSKFDRKHYFYPDLPKGYQITQYDQPIILGGEVDIIIDGKKKRVKVTRAHLEEDAGKSTHPDGADHSLVDLNRAGTPLLEIVSEPDMHSAAEAKAYARELYLLMKYADVSNVDLYHGNMRFDVNVSVSKSADKLGTRSETKNLNSFRSVEKAVEYEIKRQTELLAKGEAIVQETRGWDDAKQKTFSQRSKEEAHDYRYFPEADLPPIVLDQSFIDDIKAQMPEMPGLIRQSFEKLGLNSAQVETLIDEPSSALFIMELSKDAGVKAARIIANWLTGEMQRWLSEDKIKLSTILDRRRELVQLAEMVMDESLSSTAAKDILLGVVNSGEDPERIAKAKNLLQESDAGALEKIVKKVIEANPRAAEDVRQGEIKAIGFLVGQVMKESQGQANPGLVQEIIKGLLNI